MHLCIAGSVRAMPEEEKPPAMPVDIYYLFEFKLDQSADAVLAQIVEKQYALPYAADTRKLFKIGVNYDSSAQNLTEWKVSEKG